MKNSKLFERIMFAAAIIFSVLIVVGVLFLQFGGWLVTNTTI